MIEDIHRETNKKMDHTLEVLNREIAAVRTGRASPDLLIPVMVDYYGTPTPLNQLATINAPEPQMITVTPFDKSAVKDIEKAIMTADLGLNPSSDGTIIRVPIPVLTEERRKEMVKHVKKLGEEGKVAIRNVRRDGNDRLKKMEKEKEISQDQEKMAHDQIQSVTDRHVTTIDELVKHKESELMTV